MDRSEILTRPGQNDKLSWHRDTAALSSHQNTERRRVHFPPTDQTRAPCNAKMRLAVMMFMTAVAVILTDATTDALDFSRCGKYQYEARTRRCKDDSKLSTVVSCTIILSMIFFDHCQ